MTIGVLALQGDFEKHARMLERCGAQAWECRTAADLARVDGLIIPGGESSTMLKLIEYMGLMPALRAFAKPVFGTCAGAILLAKEVKNPAQASLGLMDLTVERNGYGRQIDSHISRLAVEGGELEAVFIRAPIIRRAGDGVTVLARDHGDPVWVEQGPHMATTFHPELTGDERVHRRFLEKVAAAAPMS